MDGNGRWATQRGLPRLKGHQAGIEALRRVVRAAPDQGIATLTCYAFSADNWRRPQAEVTALMALLRDYLDCETEDLVRDDVRLSLIGRRDRLPEGLAGEIERAEAATAWGWRHASAHRRRLFRARHDPQSGWRGRSFARTDTRGVRRANYGRRGLARCRPLIRTSGEQRLSDFLLWESAYAELHFTQRLWPDFDEADLAEALAAFRRRERRFGGLSVEAA